MLLQRVRGDVLALGLQVVTQLCGIFVARLALGIVHGSNRAVVVAMSDGPQPALALINALAQTGDLESYHLLHAARADLLRRLGSNGEAATSYARALELVTNDSERRFLERRLREVQTK